jgi:UDPglucose--hexose-1-phosphate uridylyltransferase
MVSEVRTDPVLGTKVHVVLGRQSRPNLPATGCPFCVGGLEAPDPYEVRWFPNRWPAMGDERCEVVLYTPEHDASIWSLGVSGVRRVIDLWAERTAHLGARPDVDYVLVFENRGPEVGATIAHPHGQIYAYDHIPARQSARLAGGWRPDERPGSRMVADHGQWAAWVPWAPVFPLSLELAPRRPIPDLPSMDDRDRDAFAALMVDVFARLDRLYDRPLPYMMWLNQRPPVNDDFDDAWFNVEVVSPWRSAGVQRFIAAAEVASEEYFNPVAPEELASRLRRCADRSTDRAAQRSSAEAADPVARWAERASLPAEPLGGGAT